MLSGHGALVPAVAKQFAVGPSGANRGAGGSTSVSGSPDEPIGTRRYFHRFGKSVLTPPEHRQHPLAANGYQDVANAPQTA
ncbi:hypothetical protein D3C76_1342810 [compost metagenome]